MADFVPKSKIMPTVTNDHQWPHSVLVGAPSPVEHARVIISRGMSRSLFGRGSHMLRPELFQKLPNAYKLMLIEGPVGSGKTSLTKLLERYFGGTRIGEPSTLWQNVQMFNPKTQKFEAKNLLESAVEDPGKNAIHLQCVTMMGFEDQYLEKIKPLTEGKLVVMDRSPLAALSNFGALMVKKGSLSRYALHYLTEAMESYLVSHPIYGYFLYPNIIVYIDCEVETLWARLQKRIAKAGPVAAKESGDRMYTKEVLGAQREEYNSWFNDVQMLKYQHMSTESGVVTIRINGNTENIGDVVRQLAKELTAAGIPLAATSQELDKLIRLVSKMDLDGED